MFKNETFRNFSASEMFTLQYKTVRRHQIHSYSRPIYTIELLLGVDFVGSFNFVIYGADSSLRYVTASIILCHFLVGVSLSAL